MEFLVFPHRIGFQAISASGNQIHLGLPWAHLNLGPILRPILTQDAPSWPHLGGSSWDSPILDPTHLGPAWISWTPR